MAGPAQTSGPVLIGAPATDEATNHDGRVLVIALVHPALIFVAKMLHGDLNFPTSSPVITSCAAGRSTCKLSSSISALAGGSRSHPACGWSSIGHGPECAPRSRNPWCDPMAKPNYGIDAPTVLRNFSIGAAAGIIGGLLLLHYVGPIGRTFLSLGYGCGLGAL